jgi:hypothetical protein
MAAISKGIETEDRASSARIPKPATCTHCRDCHARPSWAQFASSARSPLDVSALFVFRGSAPPLYRCDLLTCGPGESGGTTTNRQTHDCMSLVLKLSLACIVSTHPIAQPSVKGDPSLQEEHMCRPGNCPSLLSEARSGRSSHRRSFWCWPTGEVGGVQRELQMQLSSAREENSK